MTVGQLYPTNSEKGNEPDGLSAAAHDGVSAEDLAHAIRHLDTDGASIRILRHPRIEAAHYTALIEGMAALPAHIERDSMSISA